MIYRSIGGLFGIPAFSTGLGIIFGLNRRVWGLMNKIIGRCCIGNFEMLSNILPVIYRRDCFAIIAERLSTLGREGLLLQFEGSVAFKIDRQRNHWILDWL